MTTDQPIVFTTSAGTATATARNVSYSNCKELLTRGGRIAHWRVSGTTTGSVEIDDCGVGYEIVLVPGATIQAHHLPDGVAVVFRPSDVVRVVAVDEPHDLVPVYLPASTG
jgi:hypothetical protein